MPLRGGASDKIGNRYERLWTVNCLVEVLLERASSIWLEPPGAEGHGCEFVLRRGGGREFHQVKRQHHGRTWSISSLKEVLTNANERLAEPGDQFHFVSMVPAPDLADLCDFVSVRSSFEEVLKLPLNKGIKESLDKLRLYLKISDADLFELLRSLVIRTIDERTLEANLRSILDARLVGDSKHSLRILASFVDEHVYRELTTATLWDLVHAAGLRSQEFSKDRRLLPAVNAANARYARSFANLDMGLRPIQRDEAVVIFEALADEHGAKAIWLLGTAGSGKSAVIAQLIEKLVGARVPYLALRADQIGAATSSYDLGASLGLDVTPSAALEGVTAELNTGVLIIDQLDSLSTIAGRNPSTLNAIAELVAAACVTSKLRVVLCCRQFDFDADNHIRAVLKSDTPDLTVALGVLSESSVSNSLVNLGVDISQLSVTLRDLLRLPLHLSMFTNLFQQGADRLNSIESVSALFDRYWDFKQRALEPVVTAQQWLGVVRKLALQMSESAMLAVPTFRLDDLQDCARRMTSENVIVLSGNKYSFFHETFFDYAFSRTLLGGGADAFDWLRDTEQGLFRRGQLRQLLAFLRSNQQHEYVAFLSRLLQSNLVRPHLKQLVLLWLGSLPDPSKNEVAAIASVLDDPKGSLWAQSWNAIRRSPVWFWALDDQNHWDNWLSKGDEFADQCAWLFRFQPSTSASRIAQLLAPLLFSSPEWNYRIRLVTTNNDLFQDSSFRQLTRRLVQTGVFHVESDGSESTWSFWDMIQSMSRHSSSDACEVAGDYLIWCSTLSENQPGRRWLDGGDFSLYRHEPTKEMIDLAEAFPREFVENVLPQMVQLMKSVEIEKRGLLPNSRIWNHRSIDRLPHRSSDALFLAAERALSWIAVNRFDELQRLVVQQWGEESESLCFLLVRTLTAGCPRAANLAVDYLLADLRRLSVGYFEAPYWATRELLVNATATCSDEQFCRLENAILKYRPFTWPGQRPGRDIDRAHFELLSACREDRLSPEGKRRLREVQRRFSAKEPERPSGVRSGWIKSPISPESADVMSDTQWKHAMATYDSDERKPGERRLFVGGARELSGELARVARTEPVRFAELLLSLDNPINPAYRSAVLSAAVESYVETNDPSELAAVLALIRAFHSLPERPMGRAILQAYESLSRRAALGNDDISTLVWYALNDPDPEEELWAKRASANEDYLYGGDPSSAGLNSVRGLAAHVIAVLLERHPSRLGELRPTIERLVEDPSTSVRAWVAEILLVLAQLNRPLATELFLRLCDTEDRLLGTTQIERFLYHNLSIYTDELKPIAARMLNSSDEETRRIGARQSALLSLVGESASDLIFLCVNGDAAMRTGVAAVFAANADSAAFRQSCLEGLKSFFNDPEPAVREAAAHYFRSFDRQGVDLDIELAASFVGSIAFDEHADDFFHLLERQLNVSTPVVADAADRFVSNSNSEIANISYGAAGTAMTVSDVLTRACAQSQGNPSLLARFLNCIDKLVLAQAWGVDRALDRVDR